MTWRDLDSPTLITTQSGGTDAITENQDEQRHQVYAYWSPLDRVAVNASLVYDRYKADKGDATEFGARPEKVTTISSPVGVRYFRPTGLFKTAVGTSVDQDVTRSDTAIQLGQAEGDDQFFLVDAAIGYRFKKRRGIASLGVNNLFDKDFRYQDDSYREFSNEATAGPYFPDRTVMGRLTLNF